MKTTTLHLDTVDSTNRYLHDYAATHPWDGTSAEMVVVTADYQTAGRGQGANSWESEPGRNVLMSVLTHPTAVAPRRQFVLSMAIALAVGDALEHYADGISLKWPNDIYWHDSKLSGTLMETRIVGGTIVDCISGTGINVNQHSFAGGAPNAVSLWHITGRETPTDELRRHVVDAYGRYHAMAQRGEHEALSALYHARLYRRGEEHTYEDDGGRFIAVLTGVDERGQLLLRRAEGLRAYDLKEVRFVTDPRH